MDESREPFTLPWPSETGGTGKRVTMTDPEPVLIELDARNRASLGKLARHRRYLAQVHHDGMITLVPATVVPASTTWPEAAPGSRVAPVSAPPGTVREVDAMSTVDNEGRCTARPLFGDVPLPQEHRERLRCVMPANHEPLPGFEDTGGHNFGGVGPYTPGMAKGGD